MASFLNFHSTWLFLRTKEKLCTVLSCREAFTGQAAVHSVSADIDQKICFCNSANYSTRYKLLGVYPYNAL